MPNNYLCFRFEVMSGEGLNSYVKGEQSMGHDIYGTNKADEEICYMRFGMSNIASYQFYEFFDAMEHHGGVSGLGVSVDYTPEQIKKAFLSYEKVYGTNGMEPIELTDDFESYEKGKMLTFILTCLSTAREEGTVTIIYA